MGGPWSDILVGIRENHIVHDELLGLSHPSAKCELYNFKMKALHKEHTHTHYYIFHIPSFSMLSSSIINSSLSSGWLWEMGTGWCKWPLIGNDGHKLYKTFPCVASCERKKNINLCRIQILTRLGGGSRLGPGTPLLLSCYQTWWLPSVINTPQVAKVFVTTLSKRQVWWSKPCCLEVACLAVKSGGSSSS